MKRFDERAEASAERRRDDGDGGPPPAVVKAVRRALATEHRKLENDLSSLDVLLSMGDNPNSPPEQGPPQPGSNSYNLAIEFFGRVAGDVRKIRVAVGAVDFDPEDKQKLRLALKEIAAAWDLRAQAFASTDQATASSLLAQIKEREKKAAASKRVLMAYLPEEGES